MNQEIKDTIIQNIDSLDKELREISLKIHDDPELGNREFHAYKLLTGYLEGKGFSITHHAVGLETAFIAKYVNDDAGRRVGFCCEYDALPGVNHGCGHNLIAISGLASALSMKVLMDKGLAKGTVVVFGTPAEESTSGKATFVNKNAVKTNVDFAMMLHPYPVDELYGPMLALDSCHIEFFGKASHAGQAPWMGINALDAIMQAFNNVAMLRQQTLPTNRLHGIITKGGESANVIPAYASCYFYIRSITKNQLEELKVKFLNCFVAAARSTQCQYKIKWNENGPIDDVFMNDTMTLLFKKYQMEQGIHFKDRATEVSEYASGSTDMGNFSYDVPSIHPHFGIHTDAANHTVGFEQASRTEVAHQDTIKAAKSLSFTAAEVLVDDRVYQSVVDDFNKGKPQ